MHNVFIAVGGSGTKVAEMLVRLLGVGFPTSATDGLLTSADDTLEIWCVDPDRSSASIASLKVTVKDYVDLQGLLGDPKTESDQGKSAWSMTLDPTVRHLDPLQLGRGLDSRSNNQTKTLGGILDSGDHGRRSVGPMLRLFYEEKDLNVTVDRGFYQKPFIGAPIMAVFAETLKNENSPGGREINLRTLQTKPVRFFLAGSLHGGTGACGVPVMGRFFADLRRQSSNLNWRVGGCLLAPYAFPPDPPFSRLQHGETITEEMIDNRLSSAAGEEAFRGLTPEEKRQLVRQILEGFYADPADMDERARHGLLYYNDHGASYFDELYLVGKPEPDRLPTWSNGGRSQQNPHNAAEAVGAVAALHFFSGAIQGRNEGNYLIGTSSQTVGKAIRLRDLPRYASSRLPFDPERVVLVTAVLRHLLTHQIPWDQDIRRWSGIDPLKAIYANEMRKNDDRKRYAEAMKIIERFLTDLLDGDRTMGWADDDLRQVRAFFNDDALSVEAILEKTRKKGFFGNEPRAALTVGSSAVKLTGTEFGTWAPSDSEFTRGAYMRYIWTQLYNRANDAKLVAA